MDKLDDFRDALTGVPTTNKNKKLIDYYVKATNKLNKSDDPEMEGICDELETTIRNLDSMSWQEVQDILDS